MEKNLSLIIGGTGGIGIETAKTLLDEGMKVCVCGRDNLESARKELIAFKETDVDFYNLDLTKKESVEKTISLILNKHKEINSIIYSVSNPIKHSKIENLEWVDFQEHIDIQIKGFLTVVQAILAKVENPKIKFVVVLTEYCIGKPPAGISNYITAKYGLMGFVKAMASELSRGNCTFNMVSPGMVDTKLLSNLPPKLIEITAHQNPLGRISKPKDVANVLSFLVSDKADYLNGVNIPINGGNIFT